MPRGSGYAQRSLARRFQSGRSAVALKFALILATMGELPLGTYPGGGCLKLPTKDERKLR